MGIRPKYQTGKPIKQNHIPLMIDNKLNMYIIKVGKLNLVDKYANGPIRSVNNITREAITAKSTISIDRPHHCLRSYLPNYLLLEAILHWIHTRQDQHRHLPYHERLP